MIPVHTCEYGFKKYQRYLSAKIFKFTKRRSGSIFHLYGAANKGVKIDMTVVCCRTEDQQSSWYPLTAEKKGQ